MSGTTEFGAALRDGRLADARALAAARVKAAPSDPAARLDLADVLIVLGEWDRADTHLDMAGTLDPTRAVRAALARQLVRAAAWRDDAFTSGRPPELVTEPDAAVAHALARLAGRAPDAEPPAPTGTCDGAPFDALRDADDRTAGVLEVLTSTGKYMWVPFAAVASLRPSRPEGLRDLVWRPAELDVAGGPGGVVYLPATYHAAAPTDAQRLGRETDWVEAADGTATGLGARCLLVGDDLKTFDDFAELTVTPA